MNNDTTNPTQEQGASLPSFLNRVTLGDCLQVLRRLPDATVDLVLTDPPYAVRYQTRDGRTLTNDDNTRWIFPAFSEMYRVLKPDSYCISFCAMARADRFIFIWRECGFRILGSSFG